MCLGIPGEIKKINDDTATVSIGGAEYNANLQMIDDARIGDYVLVHTGFAIEKLSPEEAEETLKLLREIGELPTPD